MVNFSSAKRKFNAKIIPCTSKANDDHYSFQFAFVVLNIRINISPKDDHHVHKVTKFLYHMENIKIELYILRPKCLTNVY